MNSGFTIPSSIVVETPTEPLPNTNIPPENNGVPNVQIVYITKEVYIKPKSALEALQENFHATHTDNAYTPIAPHLIRDSLPDPEKVAPGYTPIAPCLVRDAVISEFEAQEKNRKEQQIIAHVFFQVKTIVYEKIEEWKKMKHPYTREDIIQEIHQELTHRNITHFSYDDVSQRLEKHEGITLVPHSTSPDDPDGEALTSAAERMLIKVHMLRILQDREKNNIQRNVEWLLRETRKKLNREKSPYHEILIRQRYNKHIIVSKDRHVTYQPSIEEAEERLERETINKQLRLAHEKRVYEASLTTRDRITHTMESAMTNTKTILIQNLNKRQEKIITPLLSTHNRLTLTLKDSIPQSSLSLLKEKGGNALTIVRDTTGKATSILLDVKTYQSLLQKTPKLIDDICESDPDRHITIEGIKYTFVQFQLLISRLQQNLQKKDHKTPNSG